MEGVPRNKPRSMDKRWATKNILVGIEERVNLTKNIKNRMINVGKKLHHL